jgi:hypothetical protein
LSNKLNIKLKDILPTKEELIKLKFLQENEEDLVEVDIEGCEELLEQFEINCGELGFSSEEVHNLVLLIEALNYAKEEWEVE